jgi:hypothetical protein
MPKPVRMTSALIGAVVLMLAALVSVPSAMAAPITVNLRVEGSTGTLFEGPVSTEAIEPAPGISTPSSGGAHPCDVKFNGSNEGFATAAATPTGALYDAALASGLTFDAGWSNTFMDFNVAQVGGDVENANGNGEYWGYAVNYTTAGVGGCQFQLAAGSEVLWAYNYFNLPQLLSLSGPASVTAGTPFTVRVTDGQSGQPVAGAAIGAFHDGVTSTSASTTTDAAGNATITLTQAGVQSFKATHEGAVRSNGLSICVHSGNDGNCGTTLQGAVTTTTGAGATTGTNTVTPKADVAKVVGLTSHHLYARRHAPRLLGGVVDVPAGVTLRQVRISLQRRSAGHCLNFSGRLERFVKAKCLSTLYFSVGSAASFSYLLPSRLPSGHYTYDIQAVDSAGRHTALAPGVSQVTFDVR